MTACKIVHQDEVYNPSTRKYRQKDQKFKAILSSTWSLRLD